MTSIDGICIDRGVNTFSPEGRLFQGSRWRLYVIVSAINSPAFSRVCHRSYQGAYANLYELQNTLLTPSKLGSTTVGIKTPEGVVLGVEKRVQSPLLESSSIEKIMEIDRHLGCAMSGLTADARTMIDHARVTAQNHAFTYDENIKVESVTQAVCDLALRFGESVHDEEAMMSRPFGVALLIAGIDEKGPQLYVPSRVPVLLGIPFSERLRLTSSSQVPYRSVWNLHPV